MLYRKMTKQDWLFGWDYCILQNCRYCTVCIIYCILYPQLKKTTICIVFLELRSILEQQENILSGLNKSLL